MKKQYAVHFGVSMATNPPGEPRTPAHEDVRPTWWGESVNQSVIRSVHDHVASVSSATWPPGEPRTSAHVDVRPTYVIVLPRRY